ncbi:threonine-phosphate decarboxylase CobD [Roseibium litorale]|uniref:threonine-phosphate decarboxylase n=1 Tax=Roseibium litorale TaxID=2803841 RepID=A0ABR9CT41_9HYPH|nr:threonine-phosphate decarboxylase CobD [Roseibium litorale]MBD8894061.1 threonine-phosphate decarboxylase [Roseibium litorale]
MIHGGDLAGAMARHGGTLADWLDLSTGINPHAYPVSGKITAESWQRLPGSKHLENLLTAARAAYRIPKHLGLTAAPGTQALIAQLPYLLPDGPIAILGPTYSSHRASWTRAGRTVLDCSSLQEAKDSDAAILLLVNPNNPDGRVTAPQELLELARARSVNGQWLIVDEAFADVDPDCSLLPHLSGENVAVLRSFGKFYGLAGLRLGFLAAPAGICDAMAQRLDSWAVSGPALEVGAAALSDTSWQGAMRQQLAREMAGLQAVLTGCGMEILGGTPLYVLIRHEQAENLHRCLATQKIWTRIFDFDANLMRLGLPGSDYGLLRLNGALKRFSKGLSC